jgi:serine/threonine protein kinase
MGEVWLAHDARLKRDMAIKVLPADRLADDSRRRRFVQEAPAASALNHPHTITIQEIDSAGVVDIIVMELRARQEPRCADSTTGNASE